MNNTAPPPAQPGYASIPPGQTFSPSAPAPHGYATPQGQPQYTAPQGQPQYPNSQGADNQPQPDYDEGKLGAIFGKDVVLDIKAKLKTPDEGENSAQMDGRYSVYGLTLTKNLPGRQSVTVRCNLEWVDILGMAATALKHAFRPARKLSASLTKDGLANVITSVQAMAVALGAIQQGQNAQQPVNDAIVYLSNALSDLNRPTEPDYELDQVKVIPNTMTQDGYSQVTSCKIQRVGHRADGSPSRYPWVVTVENFEAVKVVKPNGTTTYNSSTKRPGKGGGQPISVFASDRDILKLAGKAVRHLLVWDMVVNNGRVKKGIAKQMQKFAGRGTNNV